jgi:hypothetical protein
MRVVPVPVLVPVPMLVLMLVVLVPSQANAADSVAAR